MAMEGLSIGSVNCRGLSSDPVRRRDIFDRCRKKYDITFLIDTHSEKKVENAWKMEWGYEGWFNSYSSNSRGVAILFKNTFSFTYLSKKMDLNGNMLILTIKLNSCDKVLTLVAMYGPNQTDVAFYQYMLRQLDLGENTSIIIGGDWNVPMDYTIDTRNYKNRNNETNQSHIKILIESFDLIDIWRDQHTEEKKFTWHGPNLKQARLDYFLISSDLVNYVKNCEIGISYRSDHSPVSLLINFVDQPRGRGTWKFNNSLLSDPEYINIVKECIADINTQYVANPDVCGP